MFTNSKIVSKISLALSVFKWKAKIIKQFWILLVIKSFYFQFIIPHFTP